MYMMGRTQLRQFVVCYLILLGLVRLNFHAIINVYEEARINPQIDVNDQSPSTLCLYGLHS